MKARLSLMTDKTRIQQWPHILKQGATHPQSHPIPIILNGMGLSMSLYNILVATLTSLSGTNVSSQCINISFGTVFMVENVL